MSAQTQTVLVLVSLQINVLMSRFCYNKFYLDTKRFFIIITTRWYKHWYLSFSVYKTEKLQQWPPGITAVFLCHSTTLYDISVSTEFLFVAGAACGEQSPGRGVGEGA